MPRSGMIFRAIPWVLALWIAYIFVWYLQYKFTGADGSVWLFTVLTDWLGVPGYEKPMRIGVGSAELLAAILVLIRRTQVLGAAMSAGIMAGAIFFHVVSPLGIDPYDDGAVLFKEACLVLIAALVILWLRRDEALDLARHLPVVGRYA
ncbi:MAG: DoxX family protein [Alphaproteobacteria bacterium]|nr:DoxX family protein [Alphaproteobacteria bacterium]MCA0450350.1 DoxX family protein [Pseudomonadota bacterium]